jgi:hypothetical protein
MKILSWCSNFTLHCMPLTQWRTPPPPNIHRPPTSIHNINFKFSGQTQPPSLIKTPSSCSCPNTSTTLKVTARSPNSSPAALAKGHLHSPYNLHSPVTYLLRKDQQTHFVFSVITVVPLTTIFFFFCFLSKSWSTTHLGQAVTVGSAVMQDRI